MKLINNAITSLSIKVFSFLLFGTLLSACGGGSSGGSSGGNNEKAFEFAQSTLKVDVYDYDNNSRTDEVYVNISDKLRDQIANGKDIYAFITQTDQRFSYVSASVSGERGKVSIDSNLIDGLPVGIYTNVITLKLCFDQSCSKTIGEDKLTFVFGRHDTPELSSRRVEFENIEGAENNPGEFSIDFKTMTVPQSQISYDIDYTSNSADWLSIDTTVNNNTATLALNGLESSCGTKHAKVTVNFTSEGGLSDYYTFDVVYSYDTTTPTIYTAYPKVHYTNQPIQVSLTGCGFRTLDDIALNNLDVVSVNRREDFRLDVTANAVDESGTVSVKLTESTQEENLPELTVKNPSNYDFQVFEFNGNISDPSTAGFYDAINDVIYVEFDFGWKAFKYESDSWVEDDSFNGDLVDNAMTSRDGTALYKVTDSELFKLDATNYDLLSANDSYANSLGSINELSNGDILMGGLSSSGNHYLYYFNSASEDFFSSVEVEQGRNPIVKTTLDGSRTYFSTNIETAFFRYDAGSAKQEKLSEEPLNLQYASLSQNGQRSLFYYFGNSRTISIRNDDFEEIGTLPRAIPQGEGENSHVARGATLSKDGNTAYVFYDEANVENNTYILQYDLTPLSENEEPVLTQRFDMQPSLFNQSYMMMYHFNLFLSADENTLFINGDDKLVIFPLNNPAS
ncbi:hypothetical protein [Pleionea sediminis]|uniref:hypothetical protein n=1 Tax=Pleionea sediminis TaxID=2569479 RepID=UPI001184BB9B|nr:hypothetical protein [Pleionea sediminis]